MPEQNTPARRLAIPPLLALVLLLGWASSAQAVAVPASIPADCSTYVHEQLSAFFADVPNGSTVEFPAGGCYRTNLRVNVHNKTGLTINGNGAWIKSDTENTGRTTKARYAIQPTVAIINSDQITVDGLNVEGNFHLTGTRSQQRVNQAATEGEAGATTQTNPGYGIYGGSNVTLRNLKTTDTFGDGVQVSRSGIVDWFALEEVPSNVRLENLTVTKAARHCVAPTQVDGFWLVDSDLSDCWYGGFDAESDNMGDPLKNINVTGNTWSDFFMFAIYVPVAHGDDAATDITIANNTIKTRPDNVCNQQILVGTYPDNPHYFKRVKVDNNTLEARSGTGVKFDHVNVGSIQNNRDVNYIEAGCWATAVPFEDVANSIDVTVAKNGPDAPGAGGTEPAPTEPTPAPSPTDPCPTEPEPEPTLAAPTSVAATRDSDTQATMTWSHAGADGYTVWVKHESWSSYVDYSTAGNSPRTLFGLKAGQVYNASVTAMKDGVMSAPSETVVIPLP